MKIFFPHRSKSNTCFGYKDIWRVDNGFQPWVDKKFFFVFSTKRWTKKGSRVSLVLTWITTYSKTAWKLRKRPILILESEVFIWWPLLILQCVDKALMGLVHPPEYRSSPEQTRSSNNFVSLRSRKTKSTISTVMGLDRVPPGGHLPPSHWSCGQTLPGCHVSLQLSRH